MSKEINETKEITEQAEQSELEKITQERDEWKDKCLRLAADFENFKKRSSKDRAHWQQLITGKVLTDVLTVVDNVERALAASDQPAEALTVMHKQLMDVLKLYNVREIVEVEIFDPSLHEAVAHVASAEYESGAIIEVLQKGYRVGDTILRVAKVAVAQ